MPFDERLARRVREALSGRDAVERKMMGGLVFMVNGNLCCGVDRGDLIVRVGQDDHQGALREPHVRPMDLTGRPLKGFVLVGSPGLRSRTALQRLVMQGVQYATALPPKGPSARPRSRSRPKIW